MPRLAFRSSHHRCKHFCCCSSSLTACRFRMWEPLPLIVYGYAVHPLSPSRRETRSTSRNRLSTVTEVSADDHSMIHNVVSLEVGDEVYAFEKYTPSPRESPDNIWFRGYVVPPVTLQN